ncbi:MAG: FadR family transcriptional regulator [Myxococcales bacterium]|nr:FadR family transcriptional regulator [Myxococcales bacterium]
MADKDDKLRRSSLVEMIMLRLQEEILAGKYGAGNSLPPERELAERFGVNRTSVKHALMKLEQFGLIRIKHGIGSLVTDFAERGGAQLLEHLIVRGGMPDLELLADLLEVRAHLGGVIARLAARRRSDEDLERLTAVLTELGRNLEEPARVQFLENRFFRDLTLATGNQALKFLTNSISAAYRTQFGMFQHAFGDTAWVHASLEEVRAAVEAGDEDRAAGACARYLAASGEKMVEGLRERLKAGDEGAQRA